MPGPGPRGLDPNPVPMQGSTPRAAQGTHSVAPRPTEPWTYEEPPCSCEWNPSPRAIHDQPRAVDLTKEDPTLKRQPHLSSPVYHIQRIVLLPRQSRMRIGF